MRRSCRGLLRPLQRLLVRAAVELMPGWVRERLGLGAAFGLRPWERPLVRLVGRARRSGRVAVQPGRAILPPARPAGRHISIDGEGRR